MGFRRDIAIVLCLLFSLAIAMGQGCSSAPNSSTAGNSELADGCKPASGTTGSPKTIKEAIDLINGLPKPVSVGCFLQSLSRPLKVSLTNSTVSLQPAAGMNNPRVFIFSDSLVISVVPDGIGQQVVEFGEQLDGFRSIKGEVAFPVTTTLDMGAPFSRIMFNATVTNCAFCHGNEVAVNNGVYIDAFSSLALRPTDMTLVPLSYLQGVTALCDAASEPERCEILNSLLNYGNVQSQDFPEDMPHF
jgi:hypothetical protein